MIVCEHGNLLLTCPPGKWLNILSANYGRTDVNTCCVRQSECNSNSCYRDVLGTLSRRCNTMSSCSMAAQNEQFGDPCYGIYKYLDVTYKCL